MKTIFNQLAKFTLISLVSLVFISLNIAEVSAEGFTWFESTAKSVFDKGGIPTSDGSTAAGGLAEEVVLQGLRYIRLLTVIIGILYLTILGYTLVYDGSNEESVSKSKKGIIYTLIAFLMISMAEDFSEIFRMGNSSKLLTKQGVQAKINLFEFQVELFLTFIYYIVGAYASIMIVRSALKLITAGGDEEVVTKHKKGLGYSVGGLILLYVGDVFIRKVFYVKDLFSYSYSGDSNASVKIDVTEGVEQIASITNLIVKFIGPVAVMALMAGAIMYATANGDEEKMNKAKRLLIAVAVGMVIVYGAFAVVSTFIAKDLQNINIPQ